MVKLELVDKYVSKHMGEHVGKHVDEQGDEFKEEPLAKIWPCNEVFRVQNNVQRDQRRLYIGTNGTDWMGNFLDWKSSEGTCKRCDFLRELGYELVKPHVKRRSQVPNLLSALYGCLHVCCISLCIYMNVIIIFNAHVLMKHWNPFSSTL